LFVPVFLPPLMSEAIRLAHQQEQEQDHEAIA